MSKILKLPFSKKETMSEAEIQKQTVLDWMPIADVQQYMTVLKNNRRLGTMRIYPSSLALLSNKEKDETIEQFSIFLNSLPIDEIQIICIGRPVDLNPYIKWLDEKALEANDPVTKRLLTMYSADATALASSGNASERRFYLIISCENEKDVFKYLKIIEDNFLQTRLKPEICQESEIIDLYALFADPYQSPFYKVSVASDIPTVYQKEVKTYD